MANVTTAEAAARQRAKDYDQRCLGHRVYTPAKVKSSNPLNGMVDEPYVNPNRQIRKAACRVLGVTMKQLRKRLKQEARHETA